MYETIFKRKSIRTYQKEGLTQNDIEAIKNIVSNHKEITPPFNHTPTIYVTHAEDLNAKKIGTYGFVKGTDWYIVGTTIKTPEALIDYGYVFEDVILQLTKLNYGTVWLAGTFKRDQFKVFVKDDLFIPAISPVGHPKESKRPLDKVIRKVSKGDHRLAFEKLFFNQSFEPLNDNTWIKDVLEGVRQGPSASNKQPWRIVVEEGFFHVYLEKTPGYASKLGFNIQLLDIGIALRHLECGLNHFDKSFNRVKLDLTHSTWAYIISYKIIR